MRPLSEGGPLSGTRHQERDTAFGQRHRRERPIVGGMVDDRAPGNRTDRGAEDDVTQVMAIVVQPRGGDVRRDRVPEQALPSPEVGASIGQTGSKKNASYNGTRAFRSAPAEAAGV